MRVFLDGLKLTFFPGATVRDLIGRLPEDERKALDEGEASVIDSDGHELGEGGALSDGARYYIKRED